MKLISNEHTTNVISFNLSETLGKNGIKRKITVRTDSALTNDHYKAREEGVEIECGAKTSEISANEYGFCYEDKVEAKNQAQKILANLHCLYNFGYIKPSRYKVEKLFGMKMQNHPVSERNFRVSILWRYYKPEVWDVGPEIFRDQLITLTPESIVSAWPAQFSRFDDWYVAESELNTAPIKWCRISDNSYTKSYQLQGKLVLNSMKLVTNLETWAVEFSDSSEIVDLYLDLRDGADNFPNWAPGRQYSVGQYVAFDDVPWKCKAKHISSTVFAPEFWENSEEYWARPSETLYDLEIGKDIINHLVQNAILEELIHEPLKTIEARGPWGEWRNLKVGDMVEFDTNTVGIVTSLIKVIDSQHRYVNFTAHVPKRIFDGETIYEILCGKGKLILLEKECENDFDVRQVKVINNFEDQKEQENVKPTLIDITSKASYLNHSALKFKYAMEEI